MATWGPSDTIQDVQETDATSYNDSNYTSEIRFGRSVGNTYQGGLGFDPVDVAQGATVSAATLSLVIKSEQAGYNVRFACEDVDDAAAFSSSHRPSQCTETTANTVITTGMTTGGTRTVDITSAIQEIINRAGWVSGGRINVVGINAAGAAGTDDYFDAEPENFIGAPANTEATLTIEYTVGAAASSGALAGGGAGLAGMVSGGVGIGSLVQRGMTKVNGIWQNTQKIIRPRVMVPGGLTLQGV